MSQAPTARAVQLDPLNPFAHRAPRRGRSRAVFAAARPNLTLFWPGTVFKTPVRKGRFWSALCRTRTYDPLIKSQQRGPLALSKTRFFGVCPRNDHWMTVRRPDADRSWGRNSGRAFQCRHHLPRRTCPGSVCRAKSPAVRLRMPHLPTLQLLVPLGVPARLRPGTGRQLLTASR